MSAPKQYKQDYIVRQRYENSLPPPPGAPKLVDIPHGGLDTYLGPGYASRMARMENPNIDVDALGGMNINLLGIPGIMDGDESGEWICVSFSGSASLV